MTGRLSVALAAAAVLAGCGTHTRTRSVQTAPGSATSSQTSGTAKGTRPSQPHRVAAPACPQGKFAPLSGRAECIPIPTRPTGQVQGCPPGYSLWTGGASLYPLYAGGCLPDTVTPCGAEQIREAPIYAGACVTPCPPGSPSFPGPSMYTDSGCIAVPTPSNPAGYAPNSDTCAAPLVYDYGGCVLQSAEEPSYYGPRLYSGQAPVLDVGPATGVPERCARGLTASGNTGCAVAQDVFTRVQESFQSGSDIPASILAYNASYLLACVLVNNAAQVVCVSYPGAKIRIAFAEAAAAAPTGNS